MSVGALFAQQQLPDQQMFDEAATNCLIGVFRKVWPRWWGKQVELVQSAAGAVEQVRQYMPSDINSYSWCGRRTARLEQALYDVVVAANKLRTGHSVTGSYALVRATNKVHRRLRRLLRCIDRQLKQRPSGALQSLQHSLNCPQMQQSLAPAAAPHDGLQAPPSMPTSTEAAASGTAALGAGARTMQASLLPSTFEQVQQQQHTQQPPHPETAHPHQEPTVSARMSEAPSIYLTEVPDLGGLVIKDEPVGTGAFGMVYAGWHQGQRVAIKILQLFSEDDKHRLDPDREHLTAEERLERNRAKLLPQLRKEIRLQAQCSHKHVVSFIAFCQRPCAIIMEWCGGGTLHKAIHGSGPPLPPAVKLRYLRDIAGAMWRTHGAPIVHGDLRPPNILLGGEGPNWEVKVADFGLAEQVGPDGRAGTSNITNAMYVPAHVLQQTGREYQVTRALDMYSFAMVMYEMFTGLLPYQAELHHDGDAFDWKTHDIKVFLQKSATDGDPLPDLELPEVPDFAHGVHRHLSSHVSGLFRCCSHAAYCRPNQHMSFEQMWAYLNALSELLQLLQTMDSNARDQGNPFSQQQQQPADAAYGDMQQQPATEKRLRDLLVDEQQQWYRLLQCILTVSQQRAQQQARRPEEQTGNATGSHSAAAPGATNGHLQDPEVVALARALGATADAIPVRHSRNHNGSSSSTHHRQVVWQNSAPDGNLLEYAAAILAAERSLQQQQQQQAAGSSTAAGNTSDRQQVQQLSVSSSLVDLLRQQGPGDDQAGLQRMFERNAAELARNIIIECTRATAAAADATVAPGPAVAQQPVPMPQHQLQQQQQQPLQSGSAAAMAPAGSGMQEQLSVGEQPRHSVAEGGAAAAGGAAAVYGDYDPFAVFATGGGVGAQAANDGAGLFSQLQQQQDNLEQQAGEALVATSVDNVPLAHSVEELPGQQQHYSMQEQLSVTQGNSSNAQSTGLRGLFAAARADVGAGVANELSFSAIQQQQQQQLDVHGLPLVSPAGSAAGAESGLGSYGPLPAAHIEATAGAHTSAAAAATWPAGVAEGGDFATQGSVVSISTSIGAQQHNPQTVPAAITATSPFDGVTAATLAAIQGGISAAIDTGSAAAGAQMANLQARVLPTAVSSMVGPQSGEATYGNDVAGTRDQQRPRLRDVPKPLDRVSPEITVAN